MANSLVAHKSIDNLLLLRNQAIKEIKVFRIQEKKLEDVFHEINSYSFLNIQSHERYTDDAQNIDKRFWRYMVSYFKLKNFMLNSDYKKLENDIEYCRTPAFESDNVIPWVNGMKDLITKGVQGLAESVYSDIINSKYYTSGKRKKRNNNGLDKYFILSVNDTSKHWYTSRDLTLTDDLEKLCYLLNGEKLPVQGIKELSIEGKGECPYFSIKMCDNGNTHYRLTDETVVMLNKIGSNSSVIGSDIKIKVF